VVVEDPGDGGVGNACLEREVTRADGAAAAVRVSVSGGLEITAERKQAIVRPFKLQQQMATVANNVNQVARHLNSEGRFQRREQTAIHLRESALRPTRSRPPGASMLHTPNPRSWSLLPAKDEPTTP